ncbi:DUF957 domain-containing protein [Escherichia coli]|nr:DUF957 domain-containing protein [Escherichia coli]NJV58574.1 DUF957 domain-containing protein [Escherichia coli]
MSLRRSANTASTPGTTETALLSCIKQAREDVLTLRHLQLLHQNR